MTTEVKCLSIYLVRSWARQVLWWGFAVTWARSHPGHTTCPWTLAICPDTVNNWHVPGNIHSIKMFRQCWESSVHNALVHNVCGKQKSHTFISLSEDYLKKKVNATTNCMRISCALSVIYLKSWFRTNFNRMIDNSSTPCPIIATIFNSFYNIKDVWSTPSSLLICAFKSRYKSN